MGQSDVDTIRFKLEYWNKKLHNLLTQPIAGSEGHIAAQKATIQGKIDKLWEELSSLVRNPQNH